MHDLNIRTALDSDGVLLATIDMPGRSMNVFSREMMDSLEKLLDYVTAEGAVRSVVLTSGKPAFLAGADLEMIRVFTERALTDSHEQLHQLCGHLGRLFRRLESSAKPFVAALNGLALGGGLELALACHQRVAADDKGVQLGLPEIKLGLLPGAGGTQRLPRLVGPVTGLEMLLRGESVTPARALALGLVQAVVPQAELITAAKRLALASAGIRAPWDCPGVRFDGKPFDFGAADIVGQVALKLGLEQHQLEKYPAYKAIISCVADGWNQPMDQACHREMDIFVELIRDRVAGNMVRTLFLNRQRAGKLAPLKTLPADTKLAVVGIGAEVLERALAALKLPLVSPAAVSPRDIEILLPGGMRASGTGVAWLRGAADNPSDVGVNIGVWVAEPTSLGQAVEVRVERADASAFDAALTLARWLRASPLVIDGTSGLLPRLKEVQVKAKSLGGDEDEILLAVALEAARVWVSGGVSDRDIADVSVVVAGLHPAYTGGPFTYLRQCGVAEVRRRAVTAAGKDAALFAVPAQLDSLMRGEEAMAA